MKISKADNSRSGFAVFEVILAVGVIAALTGSVASLWGSRRSFPQTRDVQRIADADTIAGAITDNISEHGGTFQCRAGALTLKPVRMAVNVYNIAPCLVPAYLPSLPHDPSAPGAHWTSSADYDTGYMVSWNASTSRVTVQAPYAELGKGIEAAR